MRSKAYVGPVTSLAFLGDNLLAGHGPHLKVFSPTGSEFTLQWRKRIFKRERIQGIHLGPAHVPDGGPEAAESHVLLWGGKRFQIIPRSDLLNPHLGVDCEDEIPAPDWILQAIFLHSDGETAEVAIITAHNTVIKYRHDLSTSLPRRFRVYPSPERCLLYSAYITLDPTAPASNTLIALAGTIFGEVLLWGLEISNSKIEKTSLAARYLSHEGSVFGVSISPELAYAASCSDDRTIRLWDITGHAGDLTRDCLEVREPLAVGWGHQARIWGVRFLESSGSNVKLISYSEDLTAKIWSWDRTTKSLVCVQTFKSLHSASGKNIWSLAVNSPGDLSVTGGADSGIASWRIDGTTDNNRTGQRTPEEMPIKTTITESVFDLADVFPQTSVPAGKKPTKEEPLKYVALGDHSFLLTTSSGWLRYCDLSKPAEGLWKDIGYWPQTRNSAAFGAGKFYVDGVCKYIVGLADNEGKFLFLQCNENGLEPTPTDPASQDWVRMCTGRPSGIFFAGNSGDGSRDVYAAVTTFRADEPVSLLHLTISEQKPVIHKTWSLEQPATFPFTTILVFRLHRRRICLAGSRHAAFAIYDIPDESDQDIFCPVQIWRHIHDDDSVTSLSTYQQFVPPSDANTEQAIHIPIVSTGRSGACKFHKLSIDSTYTIYTLSEMNVVYPAAVPRVENCYNLHSQADNKAHEILSGFRGRDFVLWNQTLGIEAASLDCEGGNRSWDFSFSNSINEDSGLFVFSKSKKCHAVRFTDVTHNPLIQVPFHGRELKALAVSPATPDPSSKSFWRIVATGAEDTTIRFSYIHPETDELVPLITRKTHTTGIQDLVWSSCGGWLFSSGSIEEVYCWKVNRNIQISTVANTEPDTLSSNSVGVVLEAMCSVSTTSLPDLRVCGLDVVTVYGPNGHLGFLVGMVRSDSSIKIDFYNILAKRFIPLAEGVYKTSCLLQVHFRIIASGAVVMFTAGTDGHITVWDVTATLSARGIVVASGTLYAEETMALAVATAPVKFQSEQRLLCQQLHQNSVKMLTVVEIADGDLVVLTGGDDTAVCVSRLKISSTQGHGLGVEMTSKLVERAHASAVTTITVLSAAEDSLQFISAGVDQQVKRWEAGLVDDMKDASIDVVDDIYVAVPDVASTALLAKRDGKARRLLVGGVGVEILEL
ncbi:hypothetical protein TWF696_007316 [Orbilia brochopaga]|uniref:Uncharacterized protein n=1 Tax=Orbilia brochopaga TaxID=3140254 RepID=A0AAV9UT06_9PEZI